MKRCNYVFDESLIARKLSSCFAQCGRILLHIRRKEWERLEKMYGEAKRPSTLYSVVRRRCRGKVIRLHDDIVFTRETNCKLARARAKLR